MKHLHATLRRLALPLFATAAIGASACSADLNPASDSSNVTQGDDWAAERNARQQEIDAYFTANDYQYDWFKNSPLGFTGVPYVLFRTLVDMYPEIWTPDPSTNEVLGFAPHPEDYDNGRLKPEAERKHKLPYGFAFTDEHRDPYKTTENVFFSCGGCHTGRVVVDGGIQHIYGAPNTEVDPQTYGWLIVQTVSKLYDLKTDTPNGQEIAKVWANLQKRAEEDPGWFYGGVTDAEKAANIGRAKAQVKIVTLGQKQVLEGLVGAAKKVTAMFIIAPQLSGSYDIKDGVEAPRAFGPHPGQMDAYGASAALVFLHSNRPSFFAELPADHPYFDGIDPSLDDEERYKLAAQNLKATAKDWLPQVPAQVDIKSLFMSHDRELSGWDGNQGSTARVIASGTSAVGDPSKVNLPIHEVMNDFTNYLPAPAYPFDVDMDLAAEGREIFASECAGCHRPKNDTIYSQGFGVDMNRSAVLSETSRLGLVALVREACGGRDWCTPAGDTVQADAEYIKPIRDAETRGYKADVLHGIWAQAPYLHNGSVPTLYHLLNPEERPEKFVRGNINYDEKGVGFVWHKAPEKGEYDGVRAFEYDTTLQGNGNTGHTAGADLPNDAKAALLEYLKTL